MKNILAPILIIYLLCSCSSDGNLSNLFMNKNSFENLINRFESEERLEWQKPEEVIDLFGDLNGKTVFDIGAGSGYFTFRLANRGANAIAADVDDRFLNYVSEKITSTQDTLVSIRKTEYDNPKLSKEEVDHALIVNTYHHIDDRIDYFSKVFIGIKKGGSLMVVDFKKEKSDMGPPKRYRVSAEEAVNELKEAGFSDFAVHSDLLQFQYVLIATK